jgi:predicted transport protein
LISFGTKRNYEDFKKQVSPVVLPLFDSLRDFCFSLGKNVIEDIRMHRIVFCKSTTFRWFLDIEPQEESLKIKIQKDRKRPQEILLIKTDKDVESVKDLIQNAYNTIH